MFHMSKGYIVHVHLKNSQIGPLKFLLAKNGSVGRFSRWIFKISNSQIPICIATA